MSYGFLRLNRYVDFGNFTWIYVVVSCEFLRDYLLDLNLSLSQFNFTWISYEIIIVKSPLCKNSEYLIEIAVY